MTGLSFYIAFGAYGGWRVRIDGPSLRITLGWVSVAFVSYDIEIAMREILNACLNLEKEVETLKAQIAMYEKQNFPDEEFLN